MPRLSLVLLALCCIGCARLVPTVEYRKIGKVDPAQEARTTEEILDSMRLHETTPEQVGVVLDLMPPGLHEQGNTLVVEPGYQHEVVGRVTVKGRKGTFFFLARFLEYRDLWRKALCYWQVPLEWVSLGLWSLVPLSYPCHASGSPLTREEAIEDLRNAALPTGADLAIVLTPRGRGDDVKEMSAWLIRLDRRAHEVLAPPPVDDTPPPPPPPPPPLP